MPFVTVRGIAGVFDAAQKQAIIRKITDVLVEFEGEAMRPLTWVVFEDIPAKEWGIAGNAVGIDEVRAIQSGMLSVADAIGV